MRRRSRPWRVLKWIATLGCVAAIGLWIVSISWQTWAAWGMCKLGLQYGRVILLVEDVRGDTQQAGRLRQTLWVGPRSAWNSDKVSLPLNDSLSWGLALPTFNRDHPPDKLSPRVCDLAEYEATKRAWSRTSVTVPCWLLVLLNTVLAVWLWWRDRRGFPHGPCQLCGYNLTGNVSGRCPECGEAIAGDTE